MLTFVYIHTHKHTLEVRGKLVEMNSVLLPLGSRVLETYLGFLALMEIILTHGANMFVL